MKRITMLATVATVAMMTAGTADARAQGAPETYDASARLQEVLPADVAERVLARVAEARSRGLPAQALERTALKGAARNVAPAQIERAVEAQAERLVRSSEALASARGKRASGEEVEAGAEAIRKGVDGAAVSSLAKSAPSGRSLAVPLYVLGALVANGQATDRALAAVMDRMAASATDAQLAELPEQAGARPVDPSSAGRDMAGTRRPGSAGGAPAGVPANAGSTLRPTVPTTPTIPAPTPRP